MVGGKLKEISPKSFTQRLKFHVKLICGKIFIRFLSFSVHLHRLPLKWKGNFSIIIYENGFSVISFSGVRLRFCLNEN